MQGNPFSRLHQGGGHPAKPSRPASELRMTDGEASADGSETCRTEDDYSDSEVLSWLNQASGGELDFYTIFGLSNGKELFGKKTRAMCVSLLQLVFLQGIVPILLSAYFFDSPTGIKVEKVSSVYIKIIGVGLFLYAIQGMYDAAMDECRCHLIGLATRYEINNAVLFFCFLGEFTNTITGVISTTTLFIIFTSSGSPIDLILNSLAINYLVAIDNDFVHDDARSDGIQNFKDIIAEGQVESTRARYLMIFSLQWLLWLMRVLLIVVLGCLYAFVYGFDQYNWLCSHVPEGLGSYLPFCTSL